MAQTNGKTTRTADAKTVTTDARTAPTQPDEPTTPTTPGVPQPEPGETSNTYAERVDLDNALVNSATSPRADVPAEDV